MTPIDLSDRLALYQTYQIILRDLHPGGDWQTHPLYQLYQLRPYGGLRIGEFDELLAHLEAAIAALPPSTYRHWLATRHEQEPCPNPEPLDTGLSACTKTT